MTPAWGKAELVKPLSDRHPVMQWYDTVCQLQAGQSNKPGRTAFTASPQMGRCGRTCSWHSTYTHFSTMTLCRTGCFTGCGIGTSTRGRDTRAIRDGHVRRAGFDIAHEDEADRSSGHVEFTPRTGGPARLLRRGESKHREGRPGQARRPGAGRPGPHAAGARQRRPEQAPQAPTGFVHGPEPAAGDAHAVPSTPGWLERFAGYVVRNNDRVGIEDPWDLLVFRTSPTTTPRMTGWRRRYAVELFGKNADRRAAAWNSWRLRRDAQVRERCRIRSTRCNAGASVVLADRMAMPESSCTSTVGRLLPRISLTR